MLLAWSIVSTWAAWRLHRQLVARGAADHVRAPLVAATFAVLVGVAYLIFPANTDPVRPSANLIWYFRVASATSQLAYWAVIGVTFGILCARTAQPARQTAKT